MEWEPSSRERQIMDATYRRLIADGHTLTCASRQAVDNKLCRCRAGRKK